MYFRCLASKALHRTLYHAEHFSFSQFQSSNLIILARTQLVLLSISNVLGAVLCLPKLWLPQGLEPPAKPSAKPAPNAAKPRAKPQPRVQSYLLPRWQPQSPPPPAANSAAEFTEMFCRIVGFLDSAELFCLVGFPGFCPATDSLLAPGLALLHPRQYIFLRITQNTTFFAISGYSCNAVNCMYSHGTLACNWPQCLCQRMGQFTASASTNQSPVGGGTL